MNLKILEDRVQEIERAVQGLLEEIRQMKKAEAGPSLEEVIRAIEKDLPEEVNLDCIIEDLRD